MDFIERKATNPLKEKERTSLGEQFIEWARSLFWGRDNRGRSRLRGYLFAIPFAGAKVEKVRVPRYRSGFDMGGAPAQRARESEGDVLVDPELLEIFRELSRVA